MTMDRLTDYETDQWTGPTTRCYILFCLYILFLHCTQNTLNCIHYNTNNTHGQIHSTIIQTHNIAFYYFHTYKNTYNLDDIFVHTHTFYKIVVHNPQIYYTYIYNVNILIKILVNKYCKYVLLISYFVCIYLCLHTCQQQAEIVLFIFIFRPLHMSTHSTTIVKFTFIHKLYHVTYSLVLELSSNYFFSHSYMKTHYYMLIPACETGRRLVLRPVPHTGQRYTYGIFIKNNKICKNHFITS